MGIRPPLWTALALTGVAYVALALWSPRDPGLEYDEVLFANASLGILDHSFVAWTLPFGPKNVAVMLMPYIGALKAYLYFPILRLTDAGPLAIRLPMVLLAAVALLVYLAIARRAVGWRGALVFALLVATDPSYLYHTRMDWGPVTLMLLLKAVGSYTFVLWWESKRTLYLGLSGFCLGLGVFDKVNFVWFILAAGLATAVVYGRGLLARASLAGVSVFALSALLGALPVVLYNIAFPLVTLREPFEGSSDLLVTNAARKLQVLGDTLLGVAVFKFVNLEEIELLWDTYLPLSPSGVGNGPLGALSYLLTNSPFGRGSLLPMAIGVAAVYLTLSLCRSRSPLRRPVLLVALTSLFILLQLLATNRASGSYHMMMLYPLPQFLVAAGIVQLWQGAATGSRLGWGGAAFRRAAVSILVVAVLLSNLQVDLGYLRYFAAEGGRGSWSTAIYDLVDYARERPGNRFVLMDWGFNTQLLIMSKGGIRKDEVYHWLTEGQAERERFDVYLRDPNSLFVFHTPKYTKVARPREIFTELLTEKGLKEEIVQTFYQKNGEAVYYLSRVSPGRD